MRLPATPVLLLVSVAAAVAQPRKTILMITDAEGVAGVCRQDQTDPKSPELRELLTGEINAAVDGFYAGGADEVVVVDGHDSSQTLSALTVHPRARLMINAPGAKRLLEQRYTALAFVGQHARANRPGGIMAHSFSSLGIQTILMNGRPVGEIEITAALAGVYDTPVIFLSGDKAAAEDLRAIVPEAETAVVKEGFANCSCLTLSAQAARDLIRTRAAASVKALGRIQPFRIAGPVTLQIEYTTRNALGPEASTLPGAEVIDARTLRFRAKDFLEAWDLAHRSM